MSKQNVNDSSAFTTSFDPLDHISTPENERPTTTVHTPFEHGYFLECHNGSSHISNIKFVYGQRPSENKPNSLFNLAALQCVESRVLNLDSIVPLLRTDAFSPRLLQQLYQLFDLSARKSGMQYFDVLYELRIWYVEFVNRIYNARFYNPFSCADLHALSTEYPDSRCAFCGALNALFYNDGSRHYNHHVLIARGREEDLSILTFPIRSDSFDDALIYEQAKCYDDRCLFCLAPYACFNDSAHHKFVHSSLISAMEHSMCFYCRQRFPSTTEAFLHRLRRHLDFANLEVDFQFQISECAINTFKRALGDEPQQLEDIADFRSIPTSMFLMKKEVWREYQHLMRKRGITKNDSGAVAYEILKKSDRRTLKHSVLAGLAKHTVRESFKDLEIQGLLDVKFNIDLFPDRLMTKLTEVCVSLWAKTKSWMQIIVDMTKEFFDTYGTLIIILCGVILMKFADRMFGTSSWWSIFSFTVVYLCNMWNKKETMDLEERILNLQNLADSYENQIACSKQLSKDNPFLGLEMQGDNQSFMTRLIQTVCIGFGLKTPNTKSCFSFMDFCKMTTVTASAFRTWREIFTFLGSWSLKIYAYFFGDEETRSLMAFGPKCIEVVEWMKTVRELSTEECRRDLALDPKMHDRVFAAQKLGHQYWNEAILLNNAKLESTVRYMCSVVDSLAKEAEIAKLARRVRFDPLSIRLTGGPGLGKSSCITMLGEKLYEKYGAPRLNWLHSRTAGQKWWDDYLRQKVILYDDPFALAGTFMEEAIRELFSVKTNAPFVVPQASCPLKGMHFEGEIVLITCNELGLDLGNIAYTPAAVYRRFDYQVTAFLRKEYRSGKTHDKVTKADVDRVPTHVRNTMGHLEFQRSDPENNHALIGGLMDWNELLVDAGLCFEKHIRAQANVLRMNKTRYPAIVENLMRADALKQLEESDGYVDLNCLKPESEVHHSVLDISSEKDDANLLSLLRNLRDYKYINKAIDTMTWLQSLVDSAWKKAKSFFCEHPLGMILAGTAASAILISAGAFIDSVLGKMFGHSDSKLPDIYYKSNGQTVTLKPNDKEYEPVGAALFHGYPPTKAGIAKMYAEVPDAHDSFLDTLVPEMLPSGDETTRKSKRVKITPRKNVFKALKMEASVDPNAHELIRHRLPQNMFTIEHLTPSGVSTKMRATAVGGRVLIMPKHFFLGYEKGSRITVSDGKTEFFEEIVFDRIVEIEDRDIAAYEMSAVFPLQKKISHLFIKEQDVDKISVAKGALFLKDGTYGLVEFGTLSPIRQADNACYSGQIGNDGEDFHILRGWSLDVSTSKGDCGAMIMVFDTHAQKKLVGQHVAGKQNLSCSELLTEELIEGFLEHFADSTGKLSATDLDKSYVNEDGDSMLEIQGNFTPVAVLDSKWMLRQPDNTDIKPSVLYDKIFPHLTEPAVLKPSDPRCNVEGSPLARGVEKYGTPPGCFPLDIQDFAVRDSNQSFLKALQWPRDRKSRDSVITIDTVLMGDGTSTHKINTKSSPGWPLVKESNGRTGKKWLLDAGFDGQFSMTDKCKQIVVSTLKDWTEFKRSSNSVWSDCLKSERRNLAKIKSGDTRVFTIAPLAFTLAGRVLCIDFMTAFHGAHLKCSSAVGMDPESFDWELLLRRMEEVGTDCFDGDYKKFDSMLPPELMYQAMELVSDFYDLYTDSLTFELDGEKFIWTSAQLRLMRRVMVDELIHTRSLSLNLVYQKHQGNPSGNFLTTPMNTIVNDYYGRIGFYSIMRKHGFPLEVGLFDRYVRMIAYGDDNVFSVSPKVSHLFNFFTYRDVLAQAGITYTPADKSDNPIALKPLSEMRFLKRGVSNWGWIRVPTIERQTIQEMINWVRAGNDEEVIEQSYVNIENASRFAFYHGRTYFDDLIRKVNAELISAGRHPVLHSWDMFMAEFRTRVE